MVAECATRHGEPDRLHLTGSAGGAWSAGTMGQQRELDAVLFARTVSGRVPSTGLLAVQVPFRPAVLDRDGPLGPTPPSAKQPNRPVAGGAHDHRAQAARSRELSKDRGYS